MQLLPKSWVGWAVMAVSGAYLLGAFDKRADQSKYPIPAVPGGPPTMALPPGGGPVPEPPKSAGAIEVYVGPLIDSLHEVAYVSNGTATAADLEVWIWWYAPAANFAITRRRAGVVTAAWLANVVALDAAKRTPRSIVAAGEIVNGAHDVRGWRDSRNPSGPIEAAIVRHRQGNLQIDAWLMAGDAGGGGDPITVPHLGYSIGDWGTGLVRAGSVLL